MRLTLRTMLAYLDGILEPGDAQDIANKIEESTFASDLIHRIRILLRRSTTMASSKDAEESKLGPNTVAEYLDNTLSPEKVTEFEKICLDSDIHLAEVGACHQILTLVLGEPAEVDPASRQRIYDIASKLKAAEIPFSSDSQTEIVVPPPLPMFSASSADVTADRSLRPRPTIPDYLREPVKNYRWVSIAVASVIVVCLAIVALKAFGFFDRKTPAGNTIARVESKEKTKGTEPIPAEKTGEKTAISVAPAIEPKKSADGEQPSTFMSPTEKSETAVAPEKTSKQPETTAAIGADADQGTNKTVSTAKELDKKEPDKTAVETSVEKPAEPAADSGEAKASEEKTVSPAERLGRCLSEDQILLKSAGMDADWQRVASEEFLTAGQMILALPTYRPKIAIGADVNLRMLGGTELELLPSKKEGEPAIVKIHFGRIVAMPLANAGTRLRIIIGQREGVVTFSDPESALAVEVRRIHAAGANPETESVHITAEFFVTAGRVLWDENGQKTVEISAPARFVLKNQAPPETAPYKEMPWITAETTSPLDRRASAVIAQSLQASPSNRPAQRGLMELAGHRQKEVRRLAVRFLGYLGLFDPMVTVLDDAESKPDWSDNIEQLREAVARDPETAARVRKSLESRYPPEAVDMYRMLWGYSDKDLESGEDEKLVKLLDDENLGLRVLSYWNLKDITGKGQYFEPAQTLAKRQLPVRNWRKSLENKEIRIKPLEEKTGAAAREASAAPNGNE